MYMTTENRFSVWYNIIDQKLARLASTTRDGAREEVRFSPAVNDGLIVNVLDPTVCNTGELYLQNKKELMK